MNNTSHPLIRLAEWRILHGGQVNAQSEGLGKGSLFTIYQPTVTVPTGRAATSMKQISEPLASRRILVIEDNADAAMTLSMLLKLKGIKPILGPVAGLALKRPGSYYQQLANWILVCQS